MDPSSEYELVGFISHIGKNTACGHYVCHIRKVRLRVRVCLSGYLQCKEIKIIFFAPQEGQWTIFNDEKVALSSEPPLQLGYIYLYKQIPSRH